MSSDVRTISDEQVEAVARRLSPHLWNGVFETALARVSIFTPEQARESTLAKRQDKIDLVRRVLKAWLEESR